MKRLHLNWILLLMVALMVTSCGGSGNSGNGGLGRLKVSLTWPDATRLVPNATQRIKVTISKDATTFTQTLVRPAGDSAGNPVVTTASFDDLVEGEWTALAESYPDVAASGAIQATGTSKFTIVGGQNTNFNVTMDSTVKRYTVVLGATTYRVEFNSDGTSSLLNSGGTPTTAPQLPLDADFSITGKPTQVDNTLVLVDNGVGTPEVLVNADSKLSILSAVTSSNATTTTSTVSLRPVTAGDTSVTFTARESGRIFTFPITIKPLFDAGTNVTAGTDVVNDVSAGSDSANLGAFVQVTPTKVRYRSLSGTNLAASVTDLDASLNPGTKRGAHPFITTAAASDLLVRIAAPAFVITGPAAVYGTIRDVATYDGLGGAVATDSVWLLRTTAANTHVVSQLNKNTGAILGAGTTFTFTSTDVPVAMSVGHDPITPANPVFYIVSQSGRVQRYKTSGTSLVADPSGIELSTLTALDVDTDGKLVYVLDGTADKVLVLRYDGSLLTTITVTPPNGTVQRIAVNGASTDARSILVSYSGGAANGLIRFDQP